MGRFMRGEGQTGARAPGLATSFNALAWMPMLSLSPRRSWCSGPGSCERLAAPTGKRRNGKEENETKQHRLLQAYPHHFRGGHMTFRQGRALLGGWVDVAAFV